MQANYILDTRLRSLRKLEEMELRKENDALRKEKADIESLLSDEAKQWKTVAWQIREVRKKYGPETKIGKRRTTFAEAPKADIEVMQEAMVEREPITVVVSQKGWVRARNGHGHASESFAFKAGDALYATFECRTVDTLLAFGSNGRVYSVQIGRAHV